MAVSQPARFGEEWSDERVRSWLNVLPPAGLNPDFNALIRAYQAMRPHDFERFIQFFLADQRDLNARNEQDQTALDLIGQHASGEPFVHILEAAGAVRSA